MARTIRFEGAKLYPKQAAAIHDPARIVTIEASTKAGKGLPVTALVYTPSGPTEIQNLSVGDEVFDPDGGVATIEAVYDRGEQETFEVEFSDGTVITCDGDHLWETRRAQTGTRVVDTKTLATKSPSFLFRTWIPTTKPVEFSPRAFPLDPWLVGALIGDGYLYQKGGRTRVTFSSGDAESLEKLKQLLPADHALKRVNGYDHNITLTKPYQAFAENQVRIAKTLEELGLMGCRSDEKFIPDIYRYNTIEVRWHLLQGLFDADGYVNKHGQPELEITSPQLADDVTEIVESLGGHCLRTSKRGSYLDKNGLRVLCKTVHRLNIVHEDAASFFSLRRKRGKTRPKMKPVLRKFRSVRSIGRERTICIKISHPRGLFLTDHFIATHNTVGCLAWIIEQALKGDQNANFWWVAPVYGQAEIAFRRCWNYLTPIKAMCKRNQSSMYIVMPNGARIWFKSGERPDDLYGEDVYGAVLDEASRMREESWHAIRSTLTFTKGPVRIIGNVRGRKNWFYKLARLAEEGSADMAYHRITASDAIEAGVLDREEIDSAYRDFVRLGQEDVFRQLYMAEALDDASNPFGIQAIAACFNLDAYSTNRPIAAGVDLAGRGAINIEKVGDAESRDWTAIVCLDKEGRATHVSRFRKPHRETTHVIVNTVGRTMCLIDSTGTGDAIVEDLQRRGDMRVLGFTFTVRSRQDLLEGLALAIQEGSISFPDERTADGKGSLRAELESFEYRYTPAGVRYEVPEGISDDLTMALALAVKRMPFKRSAQMKPVAITPTGNRWEGAGDDYAWKRYQEGKKPTLLAEAEESKTTAAMPVAVTSVGENRWGAAG